MTGRDVLIVFGEELPQERRHFDTVVASKKLQQAVEARGCKFVDLDGLTRPGSIYEANALLEELSHIKLEDGTRVAKSFVYKGFELWWINYENLFRYFCLPLTQYEHLLEYLNGFQSVSLYRPPFKSLFSCYFEAHEKKTEVLEEPGFKSPSFLPFGVLIQILLTIICLPVLALQRRRVMVYTGDKFEKDRDYDFRMRFVYEELRRRGIPFVEFIRGIESWKAILEHAWVRRRPVVYSAGAVFIGRFLSAVSGGRSRARQQFGAQRFAGVTGKDERFKLLMSTQYLLTVYDDVWAIRIMRLLVRLSGVRVAFIPAASERSYHTVIGCKLTGIPVVGIMHGVQSKDYNVYDFMPGFDGQKVLSVDELGVWSEWWREYYMQYSKAYKPAQLMVSGPMRPLLKNTGSAPAPQASKDVLRVLFVSEEMAVPQEVLPYLNLLLQQKDIELTLKFRPYRDGFEQWLLRNEPGILARKNLRIVKGPMQEAIAQADIAVGCQSTGVLEAVQQARVPVYFQTKKWGDYYSLKEYGKGNPLFAESPDELIKKIHAARLVPAQALEDLRERYFGDPYKNGSAWVVDQLERKLKGN